MKPIEVIQNLNLKEHTHTAIQKVTHVDYWNKICELVSFARTINPDIPNHIRGYKETLSTDALSDGFDLYLTNNIKEKYQPDMETDLPLIETLQETIPEYIINKELGLIGSVSSLVFNSPIESIVYNAYKDLVLKISSHNVYEYDEERMSDIEYKEVYTSPHLVPSFYYKNNPLLSREVFFVADGNSRNREFILENNKRRSIHTVEDILTKPFSQVSEEEKEKIQNAYHSLNGRVSEVPFEVEFNYSFIALALNNNRGTEAEGWVDFLHNEVGCSLKANFRDVDLLSLAIIRNNDQIINLLAEQDEPLVKVYEHIPDVLSQSDDFLLFRRFEDSFIPSVTLAAIFGAEKAVEALLNHHVSNDMTSAMGRTATHYAALNTDEKMIDILIKHGTDLNKEDNFKAIPSELIPSTPEGDLLYSKMEKTRLDKEKTNEISAKQKSIVIEKNQLLEKIKNSTTSSTKINKLKIKN